MKIFSSLLLMILSLFITSCLEVEQNYILNPDGSGKMTFHQRINLNELGVADSLKKMDFDKDLNQTITTLIYGIEGIDAWSDLKVAVSNDSTLIDITGTAYFQDIATLQSKSFPVGLSRSSKNGITTFVLKENEETASNKGLKEKSKAKKPRKLTEKQIKEEIANRKQGFGFVKSFMDMVFKNLKVTSTYKLSGEVIKSNGFTKSAKNETKFVLDGNKMMDVFNKLASDDGFWRKVVLSGPEGSGSNPFDLPGMEEKMYKSMFGSDGKPDFQAKLSSEPLFNYKQEMTAALKEWEKIKLAYPQPAEMKQP